jgi:microcystin degradation protein MlrC
LRIGIGRLVHGSNTFAQDPTDLSHFESTEMIRGDELPKHYDGTDTVIGGALAACRESGFEAIPLIASSALAGGPLTQDCLEHLINTFRTVISDSLDGVDGLILELNGAMVSEHHAAADEYFLKQIRNAAGEMPIALVLDSRANVTAGLVEEADIVLGYGAFPHVDAGQRGCHAVELVAKVINEGLAIQTTLKKLPMLIPVAAQSTRRSPMGDILNRSVELQAKEHIHAVSVFGGFPLADVPHAGASVLVVADRIGVA